MKLRKGPLKGKTIELGRRTDAELLDEIAEVLFGDQVMLVTDESHLSDFETDDGEYFEGSTLPQLKERFFEFYGVELPDEKEALFFGALVRRLRGDDE